MYFRYHDNVRSSMAALQALAARARQGSSATPPVTASSPGNSTYDHTSSQPGHTCTTQLCSSGVQSVHPYSGSPGAGSQTHLQVREGGGGGGGGRGEEGVGVGGGRGVLYSQC